VISHLLYRVFRFDESVEAKSSFYMFAQEMNEELNKRVCYVYILIKVTLLSLSNQKILTWRS
jgi:hypothetical protein